MNSSSAMISIVELVALAAILFAELPLIDSASKNAITMSVHHGRRQKLEIADLELAGFFDEHDLQIEVGIKILVLLQFFDGDAVLLCNVASSCGDSSVW